MVPASIIKFLDLLLAIADTLQNSVTFRHCLCEGLQSQVLLVCLIHVAGQLADEIQRILVTLRNEALAAVHKQCIHGSQRQVLLEWSLPANILLQITAVMGLASQNLPTVYSTANQLPLRCGSISQAGKGKNNQICKGIYIG